MKASCFIVVLDEFLDVYIDWSLLVFSFVGKNHPDHRVPALGVPCPQLAVLVPPKCPENVALK